MPKYQIKRQFQFLVTFMNRQNVLNKFAKNIQWCKGRLKVKNQSSPTLQTDLGPSWGVESPIGSAPPETEAFGGGWPELL